VGGGFCGREELMKMYSNTLYYASVEASKMYTDYRKGRKGGKGVLKRGRNAKEGGAE